MVCGVESQSSYGIALIMQSIFLRGRAAVHTNTPHAHRRDRFPKVARHHTPSRARPGASSAAVLTAASARPRRNPREPNQRTMGRHDRFLLLAAAEAENSRLETKHGSVLVRAGKVISSGHNSDRTRMASLPGTPNAMISLHSELAALHAAAGVPWVLRGLHE